MEAIDKLNMVLGMISFIGVVLSIGMYRYDHGLSKYSPIQPADKNMNTIK